MQTRRGILMFGTSSSSFYLDFTQNYWLLVPLLPGRGRCRLGYGKNYVHQIKPGTHGPTQFRCSPFLSQPDGGRPQQPPQQEASLGTWTPNSCPLPHVPSYLARPVDFLATRLHEAPRAHLTAVFPPNPLAVGNVPQAATASTPLQ